MAANGKSVKKNVNGGKGGKEAFVPFTPFSHEQTRDLVYRMLSHMGNPIDEKIDFTTKAGKSVYSYFVKVLKQFNGKDSHILNIMLAQSTMAHFEALKTKNPVLANTFIAKLNFDDKSEADIKSLDGKVISGITLKYGEKLAGDFLHRSITFNIANANTNALYEQTISIANKINDMLNGKVTPVSEPSEAPKGLTILKKPDNFPVLSAKSKPFVAAVAAAAAPVITVAQIFAEVKTETKAEVKTTGETTISEKAKIIEMNKETIKKMESSKLELEKEVSTFDDEMEKFVKEMKQKLEDGIRALTKKNEDKVKELTLINAEMQSKKNETESLSNALISQLTGPKSWADVE